MKKYLMVLAALVIGLNCSITAAQAEEKDDSKEAAVVKLSKDNFDATIGDNSIVLVDFWAPWCGPCRVQGPIVDEVAKAVGSDAVVGKVNVDNNKELAMKYGIKSIPTLIVFKDGEINKKLVGVQQKADLVKVIEEAK